MNVITKKLQSGSFNRPRKSERAAGFELLCYIWSHR